MQQMKTILFFLNRRIQLVCVLTWLVVLVVADKYLLKKPNWTPSQLYPLKGPIDATSDTSVAAVCIYCCGTENHSFVFFTRAIQYQSWSDGRGRFQSCAPTPTQRARPHGSPWGRRECRQMVKHSEMTQASPSLNTDDRMVRIPVCSEHACKHRAVRAAQTSAMLLLLLLLLLRGTTCSTPN